MDNCPNCTEPLNGNCACMRNKCLRCENPVGNITFTVCDGCWDAERMTDNNNPTPLKSAEEVLRQAFFINSDCYADTGRFENDGSYTEGEVIPAMTENAVVKLFAELQSQSPHYVTDAEIDEMFHYADLRHAARAMRDRIFGGKRVVYDKPFPIPNYDNPNETKP